MTKIPLKNTKLTPLFFPQKIQKEIMGKVLSTMGIFLYFWGDICFFGAIFVFFGEIFVFFGGVFNMTPKKTIV
jgi:hypothetical protein